MVAPFVAAFAGSPSYTGVRAPTISPPYPYTPLPPGQHGLSLSSATKLTVPAGASYAVVQANGGAVKYTTDGATTPTTSLGMTFASGATIYLSGPLMLANFQAIASAATLDVEYFA